MKRMSIPVLTATVILILAATVLSLSVNTDPGIYISEVCPHNAGSVHDSVGAYHDYILLTNPTSKNVALKGYALSDDNTQLDKYVFKDGIIEPGGSILVWADAPSVFDDVFTDEDAFYTGFRLRDHESLYLTSPGGVVTDSMTLPQMPDDMAVIRSGPKDAGSTGMSSLKDPDTVTVSEEIASPVLSAASGFYDEPFDLTADGSGNEVYYTVDGSDPYTSGELCAGAISISDRSGEPDKYTMIRTVAPGEDMYEPAGPVSKATVLRAVSRSSDGIYSPETIATYFIGDDIRKLCEGAYTLSIVSDPEGLFSDEKGIYVPGDLFDINAEQARELDVDPAYAPANYLMRGRGWRRDAMLTLFDPEVTLLYEEADTISIRGRSTRSMVQKGINLKPGIPGQKVFNGLFPNAGEALMLRVGGEDTFMTNFRDALNGKVAKDMNVTPQDSVCCQVYLNGEYWGCYDLQEHLDETFIAARYGIAADNVNIIKMDGDPKAVSGLESDVDEYNELVGFVYGHDMSDDNNYRQFCNIVDIDSLMDYYCAEIFFANDDAYYSNLGLWKVRKTGFTPAEDGRWRFILYDLDNTDGYAPSADVTMDSFVDGSYIGVNPDSDTFFANVSKNAGFRKRFYDRFMYLLENDLSFERTEPVISQMEEIYTKPMVSSVRRFADPYFTDEQYRDNVKTVREFFEHRGGYIRQYLMQHMGE